MNGAKIDFNLVTNMGIQRSPAVITTAIIAGWTGRDRAIMEKHIVELEKLGVKRPASTPIFYRVAAARLTTIGEIQVSGDDSSGEVEFFLVNINGRLWLGVGSDHTDRKVESIGVTISKQICDKPIGANIWPFDEVADHWDQLTLRSYVVESGVRNLYQEGPVTAMLDPLDLIARYSAGKGQLQEGALMFCGTLAAKGEIRPSQRFEISLEDSALGRRLTHAYNIVSLPVES